METVNIKINGVEIAAPKDSTIIEAARLANIEIPTLCYLKDVNEIGACRMCVVEVKGARSLVAACVYPVNEGMEVETNTERIRRDRKTTLELILSNHERKCLSCVRSTDCELQALCRTYGVEESSFDGIKTERRIDDSAVHMIRDNNKCILCRRCVAACDKLQGVSVIGPNDRGFESNIGCAFDMDIGEIACVHCGQCIVACPVGALYERDDTGKVWDALNDPTKHVVVQTAPSIRVTVGESFGMPVGTDATGKLAAALRRLKFDRVFDTDFAADMTIMEEGTELIGRIQKGGPFPLITSCSPGWIKYCESYYPEFIPNLSSCKSPQQMFGAMTKTMYAEKMGIDPKDIFCVSIMPCTAKKFEVTRDHQDAAGVPDVDVSLTTREVASMIKKAGIDFVNLPDEGFDDPMGESTGAAVIFGATGGVMEAALRTVVEVVTGKELDNVEFKEVRGTEAIKEATYMVGDLEVKAAVTSGLANAKKLLDMIKSGEKEYHVVEVMACPGGCVNGGGQPTQPASVRNTMDLRAIRGAALYKHDEGMPKRKSHESSIVKQAYDEYFEKPNSHKAHEILHTSYVPRSKF